ncbi:MAG: sulfur-oxidizing protein SoxA [Halocynthiibacter sp.]|jgi:sulfur-oxidizing protein SoxA
MKMQNALMAAVVASAWATMGLAQDSKTLTIDGSEIITEAKAPAHMENVDTVYSGWRFRAGETQALEMDDFDNPGFIFVDEGLSLMGKVDGTEGKSCASCHENVEDFAGLRTKLPRTNDAGELETMEELVNTCRTERMGAEPWKYSGTQMTAVTAVIGLQSRGMPMDVAIDGAAASFWERGKELYYQRVGQLDMACSNCHEDNYGTMIRADHLSQGQINGFPVYRLKNAKLSSTHNRFSGCMKNIRAEPYKDGSDEFKALELYLASRGTGLAVETPSVRN